jgi:hypothetical protein
MALEQLITRLRSPEPPQSSIPSSDDVGAAPASNLAALLDQFTASVTNPDGHTVGAFAHTVQALHSELALLARHFGAEALATDDFGFDVADDESSIAPSELPIEPGIAASEELEHLCRELSR